MRILSVDHIAADSALRERAAIPPGEMEARLRTAVQNGRFSEAMVISTCNRVEWVLVGDGSAPAGTFPAGIEPREWTGTAAVERLLRLACGLESIALGEPQILGQIQDAWMSAERAVTSGPVLRLLIPRLLGAARRIRQSCGLGKGNTSISHLAAGLALAQHGRPDPSVMIAGAGKMAAILARELSRSGISTLHVANRTYENAVAFSETYGACPVDFSSFYRKMREVDIVFCACAAPHPLITPEQVTGLDRDLLLVDLAMPRNVVPEVRDMPHVSVIGLDEIQRAAEPGRQTRIQAARDAESRIRHEVPRLAERLRQRHSHTEVADFVRACDNWREQELARARRRLEALDREEWAAVEALAWRLVRKVAHRPIIEKRQAARLAS